MNNGLLSWPQGVEFPRGLLGFPLGQAGVPSARIKTYGVSAGNSFYGAITAPAGANSKGSWSEVAAATEFGAEAFYLTIGNFSAVADFLIDIGVGAAGAEQVVVENILVSGGFSAGSTSVPFRTFLPMPLPSGSRVAARVQSSDANASLRMGLHIAAGGFYSVIRKYLSLGICTTYGANTTDSGGVQVDPGAVINTKGAYSDIGTTALPTRAFAFFIGNQNNANQSNSFALLDIAQDSDRHTILDDMYISGEGSALDGYFPVGGPLFYCDVPGGTLLGARAQSSVNDAADRLFDISVIGFS